MSTARSWTRADPLRHLPDRVPAFLSIDAEPDGFQPRHADRDAWQGMAEMLSISNRLSQNLLDATGRSARFGWYLRMDPQVTAVFGRADWLGQAFGQELAAFKADGHYFGVHAHSVRWDDARACWVHDFDDAAVVRRIVDKSLEAFEHWAGEACQRFRTGAGFVSNDLVARLDELGVTVDLSLEPAQSWEGDVLSGVDRTPTFGRHVDCRGAYREVFRPNRTDFRVSAGENGRNLLMVPLMTTALLPEKPLWWRAARRVARGGRRRARMLYPTHPWPSPRFFWDLVAAQLRIMERPYVSLAVRTDHPRSERAARVRAVLDELPRHPLARRLVFADPLEEAPLLAAP